jgi:hypothetical protein
MEEEVRSELRVLLSRHVPPLTKDQVEALVNDIGRVFSQFLERTKEKARSSKKTEKRVSRKK